MFLCSNSMHFIVFHHVPLYCIVSAWHCSVVVVFLILSKMLDEKSLWLSENISVLCRIWRQFELEFHERELASAQVYRQWITGTRIDLPASSCKYLFEAGSLGSCWGTLVLLFVPLYFFFFCLQTFWTDHVCDFIVHHAKMELDHISPARTSPLSRQINNWTIILTSVPWNTKFSLLFKCCLSVELLSSQRSSPVLLGPKLYETQSSL